MLTIRCILRASMLVAGIVMSCALNSIAQTANFSVSTIDGCVPLFVQFTSTSTGSISSHSWNLGNGVTSTNQNPSTTYTSAGTYTVSLTVSGSGGSNTKTVTNYITVYAPPTVSFSASASTGCTPLSVSFSPSVVANSPGTPSYSWNFGDGGTSAAASPTHTYTTAGSFNVTLTVTSGAGCVTTVSQTAFVQTYATPVASFYSTATTFCSVPANVSFFSVGTSGTTVAWDFGDGSTGSGANATHTYTNTGSYVVTMIASNSLGCSDTVANTYTIIQSSNSATFTGTADVCIGVPASFSNTTTGSSLPTLWYFGDGFAASGNNVTHIYTTAGTYAVMMVTTTGQCPDTARAYCNVHPRPVAQITMSPAIPCPAPVTVGFAGSGGGSGTYQWSWSNGGTASGANVNHSYATGPLTDTAKLVVTSIYGCKDSTQFYPVTIRDAIIMKDSIKPRYGCVPLAVRFKTALKTSLPPGNYPAPITAYNWNFGDGTSSSADTVTHVYTNPGTYIATITLTTANGCTIVDTILISVGTKVKPSFYVSNTSICFGTLISAINTTLGPGSLTYYYTTSQGQRLLAPNAVTGIPAGPGKLTITLHSVNNGCEDSTSLGDSVIVNPPKANFTDSVYCAPSTSVKFYNLSFGASSVFWDFGDGTTSTVYAPTHTFPARGFYAVKLVAYNSTSGCTDSLTKTVSMLSPMLGLTAIDTSLCLGDTVHLTGTCSPTPSAMQWKIDNVLLSSSLNLPNIDAALAKGYHSFTFITADKWGCIDSIVKSNYVIVSRPVVAFGATPLLGCTPMPVTFSDSTIFTPGTAFGSRLWDFGDGGTSTSNTNPLTYTYTTAGLYHVKLIVKDFNGCADSLVKYNYIDVRHVSAGFTAIKTSACRGEQIFFSNTSAGSAALRYNWSFGDGGSSTAHTPAHAYASTGSYTVRLIVTDTVTGCTDTLTRSSYINIAKPTASFTLSDTFSICIPANLMGLSSSTGATSLLWSFGNGSTSALTNPILTFTSPGIYSVRLIATNAAGCTDTSAPQTVRVLGYNGALSYGPLVGCVPLTVHYKALIANVPNLVWDFSDGTTNQTAKDTVSHTYTVPGKYVPKLVFSNSSGCRASSVGLDTIKVDDLRAGFKVVPPCVYATAQFIDTSRALFAPPSTWYWNFGGGQIATGPTTSRIYSSPGKYPVTLVVTNANGCKDSVSRDFNIYPLPIITASPDTSVCIPDSVIISASGGFRYSWFPAATLSCNTCPKPLAAPSIPTSYVVTGTDTNGCANKDSLKIGIQVKTTFTVTGGGEICLGEHFRLFAAGATIYHWTPAASLSNADSAAPLATPGATTTYIATGREGTCAADTHMVKVIVNPLPTVDAGPDERLIAGNGVQLQASGSRIARIEWLSNPALSCTDCFAPYATPNATTVFHVTAYTNKNCIATDSVTVRVLCDQSQLFIPNTFTPNGDGVNDYFFPRGRGVNALNSFRVYSRWGELLFERINVALNDEFSGWDGTYGGKKLAPDVYVYIIEANCDNGEPIKWKGDVTLIQ